MNEDIQLDQNVVVQCPEKGFAFRRAAKCVTCEHYQGFAQAVAGGKPVLDKYMVICGRPITRTLTKIEVD